MGQKLTLTHRKATRNNNILTIFLLGTIDKKSALTKLRGQDVILRMIWTWTCEEWWSLHFHHYSTSTMSSFEEPDACDLLDMRRQDEFERKQYIDCPVAIVSDHMNFPPLRQMLGRDEPVYVNMMPFDLFEPEKTLPPYLHGYLSLILKCRDYNKPYNDYSYTSDIKKYNEHSSKVRLDHTKLCNRIAYLSVDERPVVNAGDTHHRPGGVHVECPGALRSKDKRRQYTPDQSWYHGGIFVASNVSGTTAVWNCRVHDTFGDVIGPHGSLERCRDILGPPTKVLDGGELIWMSDRTPHEFLPIHDTSIHRQFFCLVVGEVSFWFPEQSTANPLGFGLPDTVKIVEGNKFSWSREPVVWDYGNKNELIAARDESDFRTTLYSHHLGIFADEFARNNIISVKELAKKVKEAEKIIKNMDSQYYSDHTINFVYCELFRLYYSVERD